MGKTSVSDICSCFDLKRDAYYKYQRRCNRWNAVASQVVELVTMERKEQPRVGTRKLHEALQPAFESAHIKVGRDSLFDILREYKMLIRIKKASCKTTKLKRNAHHY